jgi:hypothetical protein
LTTKVPLVGIIVIVIIIIIIIIIMQQEQAVSLHSQYHSTQGSRIRPSDRLHSHNHDITTPLALETLQLGQQDPAVRLSIPLGNLPLDIAAGKP